MSKYGVCIVCCAEHMYILIKYLINVYLFVNELCEYQNARCNDKN